MEIYIITVSNTASRHDSSTSIVRLIREREIGVKSLSTISRRSSPEISDTATGALSPYSPGTGDSDLADRSLDSLTRNDDVDFLDQRRMRGDLALVQSRVARARVQDLQPPVAGISARSDRGTMVERTARVGILHGTRLDSVGNCKRDARKKEEAQKRQNRNLPSRHWREFAS